MGDFNVDTQYVIRDKKEYFNLPEDKKQTVEKQIQISFGNADKTKTKKESLDQNNNRVETTYYDSNGKKLGSVRVFKYIDSEFQIKTATSIRTDDADYYDWDNNGTIDCKVSDIVRDKNFMNNKIKEILKIYGLTTNDLIRSEVEQLLLSKGITFLDILMFQKSQDTNAK